METRIQVDELLGAEPHRRIPGRNRTKADLLFFRRGDVEVALKDYSPRPFLIRHLLGRWLIRREVAAYEAAGDVSGLPRFLGRVGPFALATEGFPGAPLAHWAGRDVEPAVFDRVAAILDGLHRRGVALADLHHRDVLVAEDGTVCLVDLAAAWVLGDLPSAARRRVFERFRDQDRVALARMRARFCGGDPEAAVAAVGERAARWYRRGRRIRTWLDRLRRPRRRDGVSSRPEGGPVSEATSHEYNRTLGAVRLIATFGFVGALLWMSRPTLAGVAVGSLLVAAGEAVRFWAAGHLRKTVELITSGPYRYTRNPLYLGRLLIFTGLCVMARLPYHFNWVVLAAGYVIFFGYYLRRKERVEPARLRSLHGEAFDRYFRAVPALFPSLRPYPGAASDGWRRDRMLRNREHWMVIGLLAISLLMLWRAVAPVV